MFDFKIEISPSLKEDVTKHNGIDLSFDGLLG